MDFIILSNALGKKCKSRLSFLLVTLLIYCVHEHVKESKYYSHNLFSELSEEIRFGRLAPVPFKYTISSCVNEFECGQNLFDSNEKTVWKSAKENLEEWILIDFFAKRLMNQIELNLPEDSNVKEIFIQVFYKEEWKTLKKSESFSGKKLLNITGIDASLLRILFTKKSVGNTVVTDCKVLLNNSNLTGVSERLLGYFFPILSGFLPEDDYSYPGAPRKYRSGIHKGLDISQILDSKGNKKFLTKSTPVYSIGEGIIVRADLDYKPMTLGEYNEITTSNQTHPVTLVARDFGGRQIWIDHQNGVMSSYNHLSQTAKGLQVGSKVTKGQLIGRVGNSGLKAEAMNTDEQVHLHLEIWVDGEFLGNDLKPEDTRKLLQYFFGLQSPNVKLFPKLSKN